MPEWVTSLFASPTTAVVLRLALIWSLAVIAGLGLRRLSRQTEKRLSRIAMSHEHLAHLRMLIEVGRSVTAILVFILAGLMTLNIFGVDIGPLLAGAGLASLALSFGAQTLIKDFISGVLILIEGQFIVGNVISVGNVSGEVEHITLRATYLRDLEGKQHIVPNGEIRIMSNLTNSWARAIVDLNVAYDADMGKVMHALKIAADQAQSDESIKAYLLEPPQPVGWVSFKDWAMQVRLMAKTLPGKQWGVATVLRKYALTALRDAEIAVALPVQAGYFDKDA